MARSRNLEDFFLRIFKGAILVFMTLALVGMLALLAHAIWLSQQTPREPAPAKVAPEKDVTLEELKKELLKRDAPPSTAPSEERSVPESLKYLEEVTKLYRCSMEFARAVGAQIEGESDPATAARVEALRSQMEQLARGETHRGERYIRSAVTFTCKALADPEIVAWRKEGKVGSVFFPILNFHLKSWDQMAFDQAERDRVQRERAEEAARVDAARALAQLELYAAAGLFAAFMALAFYLIFARIEIHLREMSRTLAAGAERFKS